MDGDSFQGYRVIFAAPRYPNGVKVDSLYPSGQTLLAQDPRPIPYERDHTLRVEKQGQRIRVWVDRELRIDTEVAHPLAKNRRKTFAVSDFGDPPLIRSLRVWKADNCSDKGMKLAGLKRSSNNKFVSSPATALTPCPSPARGRGE